MSLTENHQDMIKEFMEFSHPDILDGTKDFKDMMDLCALLIIEEASECQEALKTYGIDKTDKNLIALMKEICDLRYVSLFAEVALRINSDLPFAEICNNNIGKKDGGNRNPQTGKWIKKKGYPKPNLTSIMQTMGYLNQTH